MINTDYYQILGIAPTASPSEIKKAYRQLALLYHPDKNPGNKLKEEEFKQITFAYNELIDPIRRQNYDRKRQNFNKHHRHSNKNQSNQNNPHSSKNTKNASNQQNQNTQNNINNDDTVSEQQEQKSKKSKFSYGPRPKETYQQKQARPHSSTSSSSQSKENPKSYQNWGDEYVSSKESQRSGNFSESGGIKGNDLSYTIYITLEEAAQGIEKKIKFLRRQVGGKIPVELAVQIPAGVKNEQKLKLSAQGDGNPNGGPNGDLYVLVMISPHPLFQRQDNNDVFLDLPISFIDAILGNQINVPTLYGPVSLTIPEFTHTGQVFRLKGKGMRHLNRLTHGDQLMKILIDIPDDFSAEQKKWFEELHSSQSYPLSHPPSVRLFLNKMAQLNKQKNQD